MIRTQNLTIRYGDTLAVDQLNISIKEGEKVSVVGPSGCGKTSLLHGLAGLIIPSEGRITIYNDPVMGIRDNTAMILQDDGLFPWKTVYGNVAVAMGSGKVEGDGEQIQPLLEELGIDELRNRYLHELSGGQRQRVAIARALVRQPDLLLMDEPTGALDMMTKERFQEMMLHLYEGHAMTAVMVTHDIEEAVYMGQRIIVMEDSKIKGIIDNPDWAKEGIRDDLSFYKRCLEVRQVMKA